MDKKKLTPKQIFRTLAFNYHYSEKIPLDILCDMVSSIYYPRDPTGQSKNRYKQLLIILMKQHTNGEKYINEEQFCAYMAEMGKNKKDQYSQKLTERIFNRFAELDPDSKDRVITDKGFKLLAECIKIKPDQSDQFFKTISDRKNQIDFQKFNQFMNCMIIDKK